MYLNQNLHLVLKLLLIKAYKFYLILESYVDPQEAGCEMLMRYKSRFFSFTPIF